MDERLQGNLPKIYSKLQKSRISQGSCLVSLALLSMQYLEVCFSNPFSQSQTKNVTIQRISTHFYSIYTVCKTKKYIGNCRKLYQREKKSIVNEHHHSVCKILQHFLALLALFSWSYTMWNTLSTRKNKNTLAKCIF